MNKLLSSLVICLTLATAHANPYGCGGGYVNGYRAWGCGGGTRYYGACGGGGWVSYTGACNGGGCYAPICYGNPYACGYYYPVVTAPPSGLGVSLFGINILGINPTLPVAVPAQ